MRGRALRAPIFLSSFYPSNGALRAPSPPIAALLLLIWPPKIHKNLSNLKVHKHEIILNFFLTLIKSLYALGKFSKKISLSFLRFSPEFRSSYIYQLSIRGTKFFLRDIQKKFFFKIFTMVLLNGFLDGFSKFWFFIVEICIFIKYFWVIFENYCMRMLSIRGNDFIACWAY